MLFININHLLSMRKDDKIEEGDPSSSASRRTSTRRREVFMKKQKNIVLVIFAGILLVVAASNLFLKEQPNLSIKNILDRSEFIPKSVSSTITPAILEQTLSIDFGDGSKISEKVTAQTAYDALQKTASKKNLILEFKEYKYGLMVEKIGQKQNSNDSAWMYSVNGKPGQIAADRYVVYPGDKIEWKYEKFK